MEVLRGMLQALIRMHLRAKRSDVVNGREGVHKLCVMYRVGRINERRFWFPPCDLVEVRAFLAAEAAAGAIPLTPATSLPPPVPAPRLPRRSPPLLRLPPLPPYFSPFRSMVRCCNEQLYPKQVNSGGVVRGYDDGQDTSKARFQFHTYVDPVRLQP